jgi:hypothetical protein
MRRFSRSHFPIAAFIVCLGLGAIGLGAAAILALPILTSAPARAQSSASAPQVIAAIESGTAVKAAKARKRAVKSSGKIQKKLIARAGVLDTWTPQGSARLIENTLYGVSEQIDGVRIGWYINNTIEAFRSATDSQKPFVLVIVDTKCEYCWNLLDALTCPAVNRLAGAAVFAIANQGTEKSVGAIASSLNINAYPTITVLLPTARMLLEVGRINGYFSGNKLSEHLTTISATPGRRVDLGGGDIINAPNIWTFKKPANIGTVTLSKSAGKYPQKCT